MKKFRTAIIIIGLILGFVVLKNYYRESHRIVSPEIMYLKTDTMDNLIKNWIERQGSTNSMLLGKVAGSGKGEEYYLYLNNIKMTGVEIKPHTYDGIRIQINISDNADKTSKVFRIKPTDKKMKYIILNDNKFEVSSIAEIN